MLHHFQHSRVSALWHVAACSFSRQIISRAGGGLGQFGEGLAQNCSQALFRGCKWCAKKEKTPDASFASNGRSPPPKHDFNYRPGERARLQHCHQRPKTAASVGNGEAPNLMVVWDPANAYVAESEDSFPVGYRLLPP